MTDVTSTRKETAPLLGGKCVQLTTGTTVTGATDTLTMSLAAFGLARVTAVLGFVHTTDYSVIVADAGTTAVSGDTLTITTATGNNNKRRVYFVWGE